MMERNDNRYIEVLDDGTEILKNDRNLEVMLSIITNFGCHYKCPYCIVKNNDLHVPETTIEGLENLEKYIIEYKNRTVTVSGGGDPFFKLDDNLEWFLKLHNILDKTNNKLQIHTSYINHNYPFCDKVERICYHANFLSQISKIKRRNNEKIRLVFVVEPSFTKETIDEIVKLKKENPDIDELSFRQFIDSNYNTHYIEHRYLLEGHGKDWFYIEQEDYNLYYAENNIYNSYKAIGNWKNLKEEF